MRDKSETLPVSYFRLFTTSAPSELNGSKSGSSVRKADTLG